MDLEYVFSFKDEGSALITALQTDPPTTSLLVRTKQHCLMGIRGTVRRSTDSWFVHCNVGMHAFSPSTTLPHTLVAFRHGRCDMGGRSG